MRIHPSLTGVAIAAFVAPLSVMAAYPDVPQTHPQARAIEYMRMKAIMTGNADGTFRPTSPINRAELMRLLSGGHDVSGIGTTCFPDVKADAWYAPYVCYGLSQGWIAGYPDGTFGPDRPVSYVEALKIIQEVRFEAISKGRYVHDRYFSKLDRQSRWFDPYVSQAKSTGMIPYYQPPDDALFAAPVSRATVAQMVYGHLLAEGDASWFFDRNACGDATILSVRLKETDRVTKTLFPVEGITDGKVTFTDQQLIAETDEGTCVLSEHINPYYRGTAELSGTLHFIRSTEDSDRSPYTDRVPVDESMKVPVIDTAGTVWQLDLAEGELRQISRHAVTPEYAAVSPDGKVLIYSTGAEILLQNLLTGDYGYVVQSDGTELFSWSFGDIEDLLLPGKLRLAEGGEAVRYSVYKIVYPENRAAYEHIEDRTKSLRGIHFSHMSF